MSDFLKGWLKSDAARTDSINVKRIYIDICGGNFIDAVIFSQIMYWHEPARDGKPRMTVKRDGYLWIAKRYEDWWNECRVPERTARDSIGRLEALGLVIKRLWHFEGKPAVHLRVNADRFKELIVAAENGTLDAVRARLLNDVSCRLVSDGARQLDTVSNRQETSEPSDATRQLAPPANRRETSIAYTETTETTDDDVQTDQSHHQYLRAGAQAREVPLLLRERFEKMAIPESVWSRWLRHPPEHLLACILHAQGEGANPPGLLRTMLDGDGVPLPKYVEKAARLLNPAPVPVLPAPAPAAPRLSAVGLDERPGGRLTVREIWQATLGQLQLQLNRDTFSQLKSAQPVRFEAGVLTVHPQQPYAAQTFVRLQEMLDQVVSRMAGVDIRVRCEGQNEAEPAVAQ